MTTKHEEQRFLLEALRASNDPALEARAVQLDELYHAREMAALAHDVYDSARERGTPPHGWVRGSENVELLRQLMPDIDVSDRQLRELLKPDGSGFRAEIYIPDPDVLGAGYKPTLVFKGSAGEVVAGDGTSRSTATEDFLGNNFPQSIGLKTDYYDRAMNLATLLQRGGLDFDIAGQSLGGGKTAAAAAVTGMRAVTFNAAGLHPETARRFADEHGGLPLYDTSRNVTAWHVQGDLLNDGVQGGLANLGARERRRIAGILSDTASVLRNVPEARQELEQALLAGIPEGSHPSIHAFLDRLEHGNAAELIRDLPQAAGARRPPLVAMTERERELVRRDDAASLGELHRLAGPLLTVVAATARGADAGRAVGEVAATGGRIADHGLDIAGDGVAAALARTGTFAAHGYRVAGFTVERGTQALGDAVAQWRETKAHTDAFAWRANAWMQERGDGAAAAGTRVLGSIVGVVSTEGQRGFEAHADALESRGVLARERAEAQANAAMVLGRTSATSMRLAADVVGDAIGDRIERSGATTRERLVRAGERLEARLDATGDGIERVAGRAPAAGAALGGTTGMLVGTVVTYRPGDPFTAIDVASTVRLVQQAKGSVHEAVERHGMASAVIPSLDSEIARREQAARALLQSRSAETQAEAAGRDPQARAPNPSLRTLLPGEAGAALDHFLGALESGDAATISEASKRLMDTPAAQAWLADGRARLDAAPMRTATAGAPEPAIEPARTQPTEAMLVR